ncbi:hypothetical protein L1987_16379 [Smallanthus sonchifolius]|uniref:Uncharacterized protein n=1 Tax=Smallanthus sonchifolius TaxID=185202 RepID=A0ACB9JAD7_9ASTR|nr:hypothetical protein L1987_16379 [Smallanthus sonchifolius]
MPVSEYGKLFFICSFALSSSVLLLSGIASHTKLSSIHPPLFTCFSSSPFALAWGEERGDDRRFRWSSGFVGLVHRSLEP